MWKRLPDGDGADFSDSSSDSEVDRGSNKLSRGADVVQSKIGNQQNGRNSVSAARAVKSRSISGLKGFESSDSEESNDGNQQYQLGAESSSGQFGSNDVFKWPDEDNDGDKEADIIAGSSQMHSAQSDAEQFGVFDVPGSGAESRGRHEGGVRSGMDSDLSSPVSSGCSSTRTSSSPSVHAVPATPIFASLDYGEGKDSGNQSMVDAADDNFRLAQASNGSSSESDSGRPGGGHSGGQGRYFSLEDSQLNCFNCGGVGHRARDCVYRKKSSACFLCGRTSHGVADCDLQFCFKCCKRGHQRKDCTFRAWPRDMCWRCGLGRHSAWRCPHIEVISSDTLANAPSPWCANCGVQGHIAYDCSESAWDNHVSLPRTPEVRHKGGRGGRGGPQVIQGKHGAGMHNIRHKVMSLRGDRPSSQTVGKKRKASASTAGQASRAVKSAQLSNRKAVKGFSKPSFGGSSRVVRMGR